MPVAFTLHLLAVFERTTHVGSAVWFEVSRRRNTVSELWQMGEVTLSVFIVNTYWAGYVLVWQ